MTDYRFGYIGCPRFVNAGLVNENVKEYVEMAPLTFVTSHLINSFRWLKWNAKNLLVSPN